MDLSKLSIESKDLLRDISVVKNTIATSANTLDALNQKIDTTLLGEYTQYAIEKSMKSKQMTDTVCTAVATCADTKKTKNTMDKIDKDIKSFKQFRAEAMSRTSTGSISPAAATSAATQ